jgi:HD-GYP domain-containing protein (c-di-GMP phosphodiesterase class II)
MLYDPERDELYFKVALGEKEEILRRLTVRDGIAWWVFTNGLPAIVNDTASDSRFTGTVDEVTSFSSRNILCVPIILDLGFAECEEFVKSESSYSATRDPASSIQYPASRIGVIEVINKLSEPPQFTVEDQRMLSIFAYQAAIAVRNAKAVGDGRNFFINAIEIFITAIESTGLVPPGHCMRVARSSMGMAHKLGIENENLHNLYYASALHDVGVLDVRCRQNRRKPDNRTTGQPGNHPSGFPALRLSGPPEFHTIIGAEMVRPVNLLARAEPIIRHHHEAWDNSGYPDGIGGDDIPLGARILAVAEAYEEQRAKSKDEGALSSMLYALSPREFIAANAGRLFAPDVVDAFLELTLEEAMSL